MADPRRTFDLWQAAMRENSRYYRNVGALTVGYVKDVARVLGSDLPSRRPAPVAAVTPPRRPPAPPSRPPALLLEAAPGEAAAGAFLIENHMDRPVTAAALSSVFTDADGETLDVAVAFEPALVSLEPGTRAVVRASVVIPDSARPGVAYDGHFTVPDLPGGPIHVRVRRRDGDADP